MIKKTRHYFLGFIIIVLIFASVIFAHGLLSKKYPTHADTFWIGVEFGFLGTMSVVCLVLVLYFLYRLIKKP